MDESESKQDDREVIEAHTDRNAHFKTLTFDPDEFRTYFEQYDLTDEQRLEYMQALWNIVVGFVDLGFGLNVPDQSCGKPEQNPRKPALTAPSVVKSEDGSVRKDFEKAAASKRAAERQKS